MQAKTNDTTTTRGREAETLAAQYLTRHGLRIIARNFRIRGGEIDLVCRDGRTLVFVEVRYRSRSRFGGAEESVDRRKQTRLVLTAASYLREHHLNCPTRFDVVALKPGSGGPELNWIKGAFQAD